MKKIFTLCSAVIFGATVFAQSNMPGITISPIPTDGTSDITITVDPAQICMPAGKELDAAWPAIGFHGGVILAAGSGALGVRLGEPMSEPDSDEALRMAEAGEPVVYEVGLEPTERTMRSAVGLVWRLVIAWMALLLMLTIALWLG